MYVDIYVNVDMYVTLKCNVCEYVDRWMDERDRWGVYLWICMLDYFVTNNKFDIGVSYTMVP